MIKAFIFDIGGTLVRTDKAIFHTIKQSLERNGLRLADKDKVISTFGTSMHFIVKTAVELSYSGRDKEGMIKRCYDSYKSFFPKEVASDFVVFPTVIEGLQLLKDKGLKLGIVTGMLREDAIFILEKTDLLQYFDVVVTRDELSNSRPHPEGLLLAMQRLGIKNKNECIYAGDTIVDIQMAKNAHVRVVCLKTGIQDNAHLEKENPDYFADNFSDMVNLLL